MIWKFQYAEFQAKCKNIIETEGEHLCCMNVCCLHRLKILTSIDSDLGLRSFDVDWRGLVYSFLLSVNNDTQWNPVISETVQRCYDQFSNTNEFNCNSQIPTHLYQIVDCCYLEHFLRCAKWNPFGLKECEFTYKYVQNCFIPKDLEDF